MVLIAGVGVLLLHSLLPRLNPNPLLVRYTTTTLRWLIGPYVCLTASVAIKSLFFGTGRTTYVLLISLFTNVLLIAPYVLLVRAHLLSLDFRGTMSLIWIVMAVDLILTVASAVHFLRSISKNA